MSLPDEPDEPYGWLFSPRASPKPKPPLPTKAKWLHTQKQAQRGRVGANSRKWSKARRRGPGRPHGTRNKPHDPTTTSQAKNKGGRPSTLHLRPDTPAKAILQALGGVPAAQRLLVLAGYPYTKMALYQWLLRGYIPDHPLAAIWGMGQVALPGAPPFPPWLAQWNADWVPTGPDASTPPREQYEPQPHDPDSDLDPMTPHPTTRTRADL